jgi:nucleoside-diphosphate-sugar epimerase
MDVAVIDWGGRPPIAEQDATILVTGANGFIGTRVVDAVLSAGFTDVRCLVRSRSYRTERLNDVIASYPGAKVTIVEGNLKSRRDCETAAAEAQVVIHLAAGIEKSFPGCFLNSVVTTRNLLEAAQGTRCLKRFVNISSISVYSNFDLGRRAVVDETCALEREHVARHDPYAWAKLKQDEIVTEYAIRYGIPYVILRPGAVYGRGKPDITARVGIDTFGIFLHLGGGNRIPFTHVDNCAEAIVLAAMTPGVEGQVFNVVDDDVPTSREFLKSYRRRVARIRYLPMPYRLFYAFSLLWEKYAAWSEGQLPPAFNRRKCAAYWKGNRYSNRKLKHMLGWRPSISTEEGLAEYFAYLEQRRVASC